MPLVNTLLGNTATFKINLLTDYRLSNTPLVSYGSLVPRKGHKLRVCKYRMLRRILGSKRKEEIIKRIKEIT
jgi:hypothetical protein